MSYSLTHNRPAHLVIESAALQHNFGRVKALVPNAKVMAVIKADAYGHGMELAAKMLDAADEFAVSALDDMRRLRAAGISKPLTLLSASYTVDELLEIASCNSRPTIYDLGQIELFSSLPAEHAVSVWLKVDTGMGRLGINPDQVAIALESLSRCAAVAEVSLMTHLANADQPLHPQNAKQLASFAELQASHSFTQCSVLNSAGIAGLSDSAMDIVRPGLMLYGASPLIDISAEQLGLKPVMTFKSALISVKALAADSPVGYGSSYVTQRPTKLGIIAAGYADGYPRHAPSGTPVLINGAICPLVGRVSMDMLAVDLTEIDAVVGDQATLWGVGNPIEIVAQYADTIAYELCCGITARVERVVL